MPNNKGRKTKLYNGSLARWIYCNRENCPESKGGKCDRERESADFPEGGKCLYPIFTEYDEGWEGCGVYEEE